VGGVVIALAVVLIAAFWVVIMVVMIRAAKAQRGRTKQTDFEGRYTYFGFLFGLLRDDRHRDTPGKARPDASDSERSD